MQNREILRVRLCTLQNLLIVRARLRNTYPLEFIAVETGEVFLELAVPVFDEDEALLFLLGFPLLFADVDGKGAHFFLLFA